jgi:hypothetical protein
VAQIDEVMIDQRQRLVMQGRLDRFDVDGLKVLFIKARARRRYRRKGRGLRKILCACSRKDEPLKKLPRFGAGNSPAS